MIEFGSEELKNYNERLEGEIAQRQILNLQLKLFKQKLKVEQKGTVANEKKTIVIFL